MGRGLLGLLERKGETVYPGVKCNLARVEGGNLQPLGGGECLGFPSPEAVH